MEPKKQDDRSDLTNDLTTLAGQRKSAPVCFDRAGSEALQSKVVHKAARLHRLGTRCNIPQRVRLYIPTPDGRT